MVSARKAGEEAKRLKVVRLLASSAAVSAFWLGNLALTFDSLGWCKDCWVVDRVSLCFRAKPWLESSASEDDMVDSTACWRARVRGIVALLVIGAC